jgi:hypothetical protein
MAPLIRMGGFPGSPLSQRGVGGDLSSIGAKGTCPTWFEPLSTRSRFFVRCGWAGVETEKS